MNRTELELLLTAKSLVGHGQDAGVARMAAAAVGLPVFADEVAKLIGADPSVVAAMTDEDDDL